MFELRALHFCLRSTGSGHTGPPLPPLSWGPRPLHDRHRLTFLSSRPGTAEGGLLPL